MAAAPKKEKPYKRGPKKKPAKSAAKKPPHKGAKPQQKKSGGSSKVEIYTASFCPHCADAKFYLKQKKIPFTEYNLERSASAEKKFLALGGKAIPLIVVKGKILRRWDAKAFEAAYKG